MIQLEKNGLQKRVSTGFSFKSLFFGVLYPIARGDFKGAIKQFAWVFFTGGVCWFYIPFVYNKSFIKRLMSDGWIPVDDKAIKYCQRKFRFNPNIMHVGK